MGSRTWIVVAAFFAPHALESTWAQTASDRVLGVSTYANCSPIVLDTKGNATININCPTYPAARLQNRIRAIDDVLRRSETLSPTFLRLSGPLWSDFEAGFHPFSSEMISGIEVSLDKRRFYAIEGDFTAWREQFTRFLGWSLANRGRSVFFSDVREWSKDDALEIDWDKLDNPLTIILIENAQYDSDAVRDFIYKAESRSKSLRVVVSFEPTIRNHISRKPFSEDIVMSFPRTTLSANDMSTSLVHRYAEMVLHRPAGPRVISAFRKLGETKSSSFFSKESDSQSPTNLWLVAASLASWDGRSLPDEGTGNKAKIVVEGVTGPILQSDVELASLMMTIAFFSKYDVALPRAFLTERLKFREEVLSEGLQKGLIAVASAGLVLKLRGMADLVLAAVSGNAEAMLDLRRRLGSGEIATTLAAEALQFGINDYGALLLNMRAGETGPWSVDTAEVMKQASDLILADNSPGRVGRALLGISQSAQDHADATEPLRFLTVSGEVGNAAAKRLIADLEPRLGKLLAAEVPLKETAWLISGLREIDAPLAQVAVRSLSTPTLSQKLANEPDVGKVASFIWALDRADHDSAVNLLISADSDAVAGRVTDEPNPARIGWLFEVLGTAAPEVAAKVVARVSAASLRDKWNETTPTADLTSLIWGLCLAGESKSTEVMSQLAVADLQERIREEPHARVIGELLLALARFNHELAAQVVDAVGPERLKAQLDAETGSVDKGLLLAGISAAQAPEGDSLVKSATRLGEMREQEYRRQVAMFSTMCPYCMAAASQLEKKQREDNEVRSYYVSTYGQASSRATYQFSMDLPSLLLMQRFEPDRLKRLLRLGFWSSAIKLYETAPSSEREEVARILHEADPASFRAWVMYDVNSELPSESLFLYWIQRDPDRAGDFVRSLGWERVARFLEKSIYSNQMRQLSEAIEQADPDRFTSWLREASDPRIQSPIPDVLRNSAILGQLSPATAAWVRITDRIDAQSATALFQLASPTDLTTIIALLLPNSKKFVQDLLLAAKKPGDEIDVGIKTLSSSARVLNMLVSSLPEEAGKIKIGRHRLKDIQGNIALITEVLPCHRPWTDRPSEMDAADSKALRYLLVTTNAFGAMLSQGADEFVVEDCFTTISRWDSDLGAAFLEAGGLDRVLKLFDELPGAAPELASTVYKASPQSFERLRRVSVGSPASLQGRDAILRLRSILNMDPALAERILESVTDQTIAEVIERESVGEVAETLSRLAALSQARFRAVFKLIDTQPALGKLIVNEPGLLSFESRPESSATIKQELAAKILSTISIPILTAEILKEDYWPKEFLLDIARREPSVLLQIFDDAVVQKFYQWKLPCSFVGYSDAAELLQTLRVANIDVWNTLMARLDVSRIAVSIKAAHAGKNSDLADMYLSPFLEELARFDVDQVAALARLVPTAIPTDLLQGLQQDFPHRS